MLPSWNSQYQTEPTEAAELSEPPSATLISVHTDSVGRSVMLDTRRREEQEHQPMSVEDATPEPAEEQRSPDMELDIKMSYVKTLTHVFGNKCKVNACIFQRFKTLELLCLMTLQDPVVTELCFSLIKKRLMRPPQEPSLQRFFSSGQSPVETF